MVHIALTFLARSVEDPATLPSLDGAWSARCNCMTYGVCSWVFVCVFVNVNVRCPQCVCAKRNNKQIKKQTKIQNCLFTLSGFCLCADCPSKVRQHPATKSNRSIFMSATLT